MLVFHPEFESKRSKKALNMLLIDRKNEFRELARTLFPRISQAKVEIKDWELFVINFCFDLSDAFKSWSGERMLTTNSPHKAITILRQCSNGKSTMNQMTHILNIAYNLAEEFRVIYKRIE